MSFTTNNNVSRRNLAILLAILLTASIAAVPGPAAAQVDVTDAFTTTTSTLDNGMIKLTVFDGDKQVASVVGTPGTVVSITEEVAADGGSGATGLTVTPPDPTSDLEAEQMAATYAAAGWSVADAASALGFEASIVDPVSPVEEIIYYYENELQTPQEPSGPAFAFLPGGTSGNHTADFTTLPDSAVGDAAGAGGGSIYASGCATINNHVYWHGCFMRQTVKESDSTKWYSGDSSQATGHGSFWYALTTGRTSHRYGSSTQIVKWSPGSQISRGSCRTETYSLGYNGTGISNTVRVCPQTITPDIYTSAFRVGWSGHVHGGTAVESFAQNFMSAPVGVASGFQYHIATQWCFC